MTYIAIRQSLDGKAAARRRRHAHDGKTLCAPGAQLWRRHDPGFPTLRDCRLNQRRRHEAEEATMVGRVLKAHHSAVISAAPQAGVR